MRRIYEDRKEVLMKAIDIATTRTIQISQDRYGNWQIGWTKSRYVDPRDAEHFADMINGAVDVANMLTRQQIHFIETDGLDPEIDSDERFDEVVKYVTEWFEEGEYRKIEAWLIAGDIETLPPEVEEAVVEAVAEEIETPLALDPSNNFMADIMERKMAGTITEDEILEIARREFDRGNVYKDKTKGVYREVGSDMYICPIEPEPEAQAPRMNNPRYCGGKEQEKMIARGWKLKIAEDPRETPREIFDRLIQSYDRVKIYYDTTRVRGLHSYFAMVK